MLKVSVSAKQRNVLSKLCKSAVGKMISCHRELPYDKTWEQSTKSYVGIKCHWNNTERQQICRVGCHLFREPHSTGHRWMNQHSTCGLRRRLWPLNLPKPCKHRPKPQVNRAQISLYVSLTYNVFLKFAEEELSSEKDKIQYKRLCLHLASEDFTGWKSGECLRRIIKINSSTSDRKRSAGTVFTPVALCFQLTWF